MLGLLQPELCSLLNQKDYSLPRSLKVLILKPSPHHKEKYLQVSGYLIAPNLLLDSFIFHQFLF